MTRASMGVPRGSHSPREAVTLTANETLLASDSGKIFFLNKNSGFTVTLPAISNAGPGWNAMFIIATVLTSGTYVLTELASADTNKVASEMVECEVTTGQDNPSHIGHTTLTFANATDTKGDSFNVWCDGTYYYVNGKVVADACVVPA